MLLISLSLLSSTGLLAQRNRMLYFMNLPQSRSLNPAINPSDSIYVGLPFVSGISFTLNNNFINYSDLFLDNGSEITFLQPGYDPGEFLNKVKRVNFVESESEVQLLGLGFRAWKGYVSIDFNERAMAFAIIPGVLFDLAFIGEADFAGKYIDLSSSRFSINWFHEAGIGFSRNINQRLRAGFKTKIIFGIMSANIDNDYFRLGIGQDFSHTSSFSGSANITGPLGFIHNQNGQITSVQLNSQDVRDAFFMRDKKNYGLSLDAGVSYALADKIVVSAAINDFGLIRWRNNPSTIFIRDNVSIDNKREFTGLDLSNINRPGGDVGSDLLDSLRKKLDLIESNNPFSTYIPSTINLAGSYQLSKYLKFGVLSSSRISGRQIHQSFTTSVNMNLAGILMTTIGYTMANGTYDNIGAGIGLKLSMFQLYATADRIPLRWKKIKINQDDLLVPANWKLIDLRLGMNLVFGKKINKGNDACENMAEPVKHFRRRHHAFRLK